jgi:hypothetical protein
MKKQSPEKEAELTALRDRILLTIAFVENIQAFRPGGAIRAVVIEAYDMHNLRDMRLIAREMDAMTIALEPHEREGLEAILKQRLGVDKDAERQQQRERARRILARGTIAGEKERRWLEEYVELLKSREEDQDEVDAIRRILGGK